MCSLSFETSEEFKRHKASHIYTCTYCGKTLMVRHEGVGTIYITQRIECVRGHAVNYSMENILQYLDSKEAIYKAIKYIAIYNYLFFRMGASVQLAVVIHFLHS